MAALLTLIYKEVEEIHVLIVDDNSPDGTGALVQELMQKRYNKRLFLLERSKKSGLQPTLPALNGRWPGIISTFLKWMPIFPIIQNI